MKNLKEFKALIKRYETITLEEIEDNWTMPNKLTPFTANMLTGFGSLNSCTLCKKVYTDCSECVYWNKDSYSFNYACNEGNNRETYLAIAWSATPEQLLTAFRSRAAHMREVLKQIKK